MPLRPVGTRSRAIRRRIGAAPAPRRVAGSLNRSSAIRLASASASPIVLVVVLVLDLFARIEAGGALECRATREDFLTGSNTTPFTKGRGRERLGKRRKEAGKPFCESSGGAPNAAIPASDLVHCERASAPIAQKHVSRRITPDAHPYPAPATGSVLSFLRRYHRFSSNQKQRFSRQSFFTSAHEMVESEIQGRGQELRQPAHC